MMSTFQVKRINIGAPAKHVPFALCVVLASCSGSQNAFFAQIDAQISQGYMAKLDDVDRKRRCAVVSDFRHRWAETGLL